MTLPESTLKTVAAGMDALQQDAARRNVEDAIRCRDSEDHYKNRELDAKFGFLDTLIREKHDDVMIAVSAIRVQTTFTNGKLRKITTALVAVGAFSVGMGLVNVNNLLSLLKLGL